LRNPTRSDAGSQRVFDLSKRNGGGGRKRAEQPIHTFYRLYKTELQPEIDRDFARQDGPISQVAHRNHYLIEKLKLASDEVKEAVRKNRLPAGETSHKEVKWADADEVSKEEIERRNEALSYNE
jgi:hypothetical protein